ncbi:hypothetical protein B0H13DRAFT_1898972 [Mycena leptocephala]|nr:hypothetical protein B0H13DRAFT_1898972 [Mycena leptocephala]
MLPRPTAVSSSHGCARHHNIHLLVLLVFAQRQNAHTSPRPPCIQHWTRIHPKIRAKSDTPLHNQHNLATHCPFQSAWHMDVAINGHIGKLDGRVGRGERDAVENGRDELDSWKTRNFAFYAACAAINPRTRPPPSSPHFPLALASVLSLSIRTRARNTGPGDAVARGSQRDRTGPDASNRNDGESTRAQLAAHSMGKPVAKTERKGSIGKDFLRSPATNYPSMRASADRVRAARPGRPAGAGDGLPFDEHDATRHIPCIAISLYGRTTTVPATGDTYFVSSRIGIISYSHFLRFRRRALSRPRHSSRAADLDLNAGHAEAPATCSDASHCARCTVGCREDTREESAQRLERTRPNSSAMGWDGMETVCTDAL